MLLQCLRYLHRPASVSVGLYHADHLCLRTQERAVEIQIVHYGIEVHFKYCLVHFLLQEFGDMVETELSGTLDEYYLVMQIIEHLAIDEVGSALEEVFLGDVENVFLLAYLLSDAYNLLHSALLDEC